MTHSMSPARPASSTLPDSLASLVERVASDLVTAGPAILGVAQWAPAEAAGWMVAEEQLARRLLDGPTLTRAVGAIVRGGVTTMGETAAAVFIN